MILIRAAAVGLLVTMNLGCADAVLAQAAPTTLLHLSATSSVQASPDELIADLVAQSTSFSAAEAQRRVNAMMAEGMRSAQGCQRRRGAGDRLLGKPRR